jgi:hypothetical protein
MNEVKYEDNINSLNYDNSGLGSKYESVLNLKKDEVEILNNISYPSNNFNEIEVCCIESLKLFISVVNNLKKKYEENGTTIEQEFGFVAEIIVKKHHKCRKNSSEYKYLYESTIKEIYSNVVKICENAVREIYRHKRKLNTEIPYTDKECKKEYDLRIISKVLDLMPNIALNVSLPDQNTEIELNTRTTSRWKYEFDQLTANYNKNPDEFFEFIVSLGERNRNNPSLENIFFEASKFLAQHDKVYSLILYVYYIFHDLQSSNFDNKKLTKTIQKNLFSTEEELQDFERVLSELITNKKLDEAISKIPQIFGLKRKKIHLDETEINQVQDKHTNTVALLNEYLQDGCEDERNLSINYEINKDEVKIDIIPKKQSIKDAFFIEEINLNDNQILILKLFAKNNFSIHQNDVEKFAKSINSFKNQLIGSINEACFDVLDDVLVEEEDEYYVINPEYFQLISKKQ